MDRPLADLKAGLANVSRGLLRARVDTFLQSLDRAADMNKSDPAAGAMAGLNAVMTLVRNERLEAPFRFLVDVLDKDQRKGRTKPLDLALSHARLAATVDAIMKSDRASLDLACRTVARRPDCELTYQKLLNLRENLRRGSARPEAIAVYEYHLRQERSPFDDAPAPLTPRKKSRRKSSLKP